MALTSVILPLFPDPSYKYSVALEGFSYVLSFTYNERAQLYFWDLLDADNNPIVMGEALVPTYPMFEDYNLPNMTGFFWLEKKAALVTEPYKEFPTKISEYYTFQYVYVTED